MAVTKIPGELINIDDLDLTNVGTIHLDSIVSDASPAAITVGHGPNDTLTINGLTTMTTDGNGNTLTLNSTDADANSGPILDFYRNSASPAVGDLLGRVNFRGRNDNSQDVDYAAWHGRIFDETDGTEDGSLRADIMYNGTVYDVFTLYGNEVVVNESSNDIDFRVEGDSNTHALFVQASDNKVGIGVSDPGGLPLHLKVASGDCKLRMETAAKDAFVMELDNSTGNLKLGTHTTAGPLVLADSGILLLNYNGGSLTAGYSPEDSLMRPLQMQSATPGIQFKGTGSSQYAQCGTIYFGSAYGSDNDKHGTLYVHEEAFHIKANDRVAYLGTGASAVWAYSSDERLKKDITDLEFGLSKLKELKPRRFKWKRDDSSDMGFIAQEVKTVLPEIVSGTGEDFADSDDMILKDAKTLRLANDKLVPMLVKAVQELSAENKALSDRITTLENK